MIKTVLIGKGYWGSRIQKYIKDPFDLVLVADSKTNLRRDVFDKDYIDAVVIATPIGTHYDIATEAIHSGKHVLIEKPVSLHRYELVDLMANRPALGGVICVEYTQTFSDSVRKAIELLPNIGRLVSVEMSTKHLGRFMDHNVYWLLASHHLSVLDMIVPLRDLEFSSIDLIYNRDIVTTGTILGNKLSMNVKIDVSVNYPGKENKFILHGDKGAIEVNFVDFPSVRMIIYEKKNKATPSELVVSEDIYDYDEDNNLEKSMAYFHRCIKGTDKSNIDRAYSVTSAIIEATCCD